MQPLLFTLHFFQFSYFKWYIYGEIDHSHTNLPIQKCFFTSQDIQCIVDLNVSLYTFNARPIWAQTENDSLTMLHACLCHERANHPANEIICTES